MSFFLNSRSEYKYFRSISELIQSSDLNKSSMMIYSIRVGHIILMRIRIEVSKCGASFILYVFQSTTLSFGPISKYFILA
jgi:hypothetical protein